MFSLEDFENTPTCGHIIRLTVSEDATLGEWASPNVTKRKGVRGTDSKELKPFAFVSGETVRSPKHPQKFRGQRKVILLPATGKTVSEAHELKQNAQPFNTSEKRGKVKISRVPGPGTYKTNVARREMAFKCCFNGAKTMVPPVEIKCTASNKDRCVLCKKPPSGDYWHWNHLEFMCRPCMERTVNRKLHPTKRLKIEAFKKIRDCSGIHRHGGTRGKITLVDEKQMRKLQVREAYLAQYYP